MATKITMRKVKPLLTHLGLLVVILVMTIVAGSLFWRRVQTVKAQINETQSNIALLQTRLNTLRDAEALSVTSLTQDVSVALPAKNPALQVVSQLRKIGSEIGVTLDNVSLDAVPVSGQEFNAVDLGFDIEGDYTQVSTFLDKLAKATPIMRIEAAKLSETNGRVQGKVKLQAFWTPYPSDLPSLNEPIETLSPSEIEVLESLSEFTNPEIDNVTPTLPSEESRADPFSLQL